jgi:uncharacterized protein (TIGR02145 family)
MMKLFAYLLASISVFFFSCTPENPTPNGPNTDLPRVTIGSQIWSSKNLDVDRYRNGDPIPQVTDPTQWENLTTGAWCYYNNDPANGATYGKLYNWWAVNDQRGLAPQGWRIPTEGDWNRLVKYIDQDADTTCTQCFQSSTAGGAMKSTSGWDAPNTGATNSTGFTGVAGGKRTNAGLFEAFGSKGFWWNSAGGLTNAGNGTLYNNSAIVKKDFNNLTNGFSIRVVKE